MELSPAVRSALIDPRRSQEVLGWLQGASSRAELAQVWRGDDGETMMHWAFLSSWPLALELSVAGLDYDAQDNYGRQPMDWVSDRLWSAIVEPIGVAPLSAAGKERLRAQTVDQVHGLWSMGVRPYVRPNALHTGVVWLRSGVWSLLDLLRNEVIPQAPVSSVQDENIYAGPCPGWMNWVPRRGHAIHAWVLSPDMPGRRAFLKEWQDAGLDIDSRDEDGRTPLWYAIDASLAKEDWKPRLVKVIKELILVGADPNAEDIDGVSPLSMILGSEDAWIKNADLMSALGQTPSDQENNSVEVNPLNPSTLDRIQMSEDES